MKMARASKHDFDLVREFFEFVEEFMEHGTEIISSTASGDDDEESLTDYVEISDEAFLEKLRDKWGTRFGEAKVDGAWRRVVFGGQVAIDNACDPNLSYLEFKSEIRNAVESYEAAKCG